MQQPKINLIYYKNILDIVMSKMLDLFSNDFVKIGDYYVLSLNISKSKLKNIIVELFVSELHKYICQYDISNLKYYIVIGSCTPCDNILLKYRKIEDYFPAKLQKIIFQENHFKYILKEKDIRIDLGMFNESFSDVFDMFFKNRNNIDKFFGSSFSKNLFFIKHQNIDCYSMFKILKFIYGSSNIVNIYKEVLLKDPNYKNILVPINELINRFVHNKAQMNKSPEFKKIVNEIKEFVNYQLIGDCDK